MTQTEPTPAPIRRSRWRYAAISFAVFAAFIVAAILLWDWNWLRPLAEARASAALGRTVTMDRLDVSLGRVTRVTVFGLKVANPPNFTPPAGAPAADFITIPRLSFTFEPEVWWHTGEVKLETVEADQPDLNIEQVGTAQGNWVAPGSPAAPPSTLQIGEVGIQGGAAHIHIAREKSDVTASISTSHGAAGDVVIVDGKGTHAGQPITFHGVGGAFLELRDSTRPYPVDLELANGPTRITLKGHIQNPMALTGADLDLVLTGPDMSLLLPLTGIATPSTPPYRISGRLHFQDGRVRFTDIAGRLGSSDISGSLDVDPHPERPIVKADLLSHRIDLADLGGFVGTTPGRETTPGQTQAQVAQVQRAEASPKLLPDTPINMPKVRAADVHLTFRGDKIIGKNVPFDSIDVKMDIDDGRIRLAPLRLGMDNGSLSGTIDLDPVGKEVAADVDITAKSINIGRLLSTAGLGEGAGSIDGTAKIKGRGASFSAVLSHGDGGFRAIMPHGGNVNSLLVDLTGLELGKALFAAIGLPGKEAITCALADFVLQRGILASRALEIDTTDHVITGGGRIDLDRELMEMTIRTDARHLTIGTFATPIVISGSFKHMHFAPSSELTARGGAAIGLGLLFPPAALLPTIQFGVGEGSPCAAAEGAKPPVAAAPVTKPPVTKPRGAR